MLGEIEEEWARLWAAAQHREITSAELMRRAAMLAAKILTERPVAASVLRVDVQAVRHADRVWTEVRGQPDGRYAWAQDARARWLLGELILMVKKAARADDPWAACVATVCEGED